MASATALCSRRRSPGVAGLWYTFLTFAPTRVLERSLNDGVSVGLKVGHFIGQGLARPMFLDLGQFIGLRVLSPMMIPIGW